MDFKLRYCIYVWLSETWYDILDDEKLYVWLAFWESNEVKYVYVNCYDI